MLAIIKLLIGGLKNILVNSPEHGKKCQKEKYTRGKIILSEINSRSSTSNRLAFWKEDRKKKGVGEGVIREIINKNFPEPWLAMLRPYYVSCTMWILGLQLTQSCHMALKVLGERDRNQAAT